jgi:sugar/nucleoside kinase (ribokinase family)
VLVDHDDLRIGGAAGNASLAWTGLGVPHQVAANTGADAFGEWLRDGFPGLSEHWSRADARTTISVGLTHPDGERTFFTTRGHLAAFSWPQARASLDAARLSGGILLVCGSFVTEGLVGSYPEIFDWADAHGVDVALDTGWPPGGWTADVVAATKTWVGRSRHLLLNSIETAALTGTEDFRDAAAALDALCRTAPSWL